MNRGLGLLAALCWLACSASTAPIFPPAGGEDTSENDRLPQLLIAVRQLPPSLRDRLALELAREYEIQLRGSWPLASLGLECLLFEIPDPRRPVEELARRLVGDHRVELAAPITIFHTLETTPDPRPDAYRLLQHSLISLRLEDVHRVATGRGVLVAVVDTGVDINHPELAGRVSQIRNFVPWDQFAGDLHGTAIAGVLAASATDGQGMIGVAPEASLLVLKACWHEERRSLAAICTSYTLAQAIDAAILSRAQVLNLSLSGPADPILERLLESALAGGMTVVAASDGKLASPGFPASHEGVLAARSADLNGRLGAGERDLGRGELLAPGVEVLTTVPGGRYDFVSGSSLAAAHISGLVALLLEKNPLLRPDELGRILEPAVTAEGVSAVLDGCAAFHRLLGGYPCDTSAPTLQTPG